MDLRFVLRASLCVLVVAMVAVNLAGAVRDGAVQATFGASACSALVLQTGESAARAGLRTGDAVEFGALALPERLGFADPFGGHAEGTAGETATLQVTRGSQHFTVRPPFLRPLRSPLSIVLSALGLSVYLITGALVLWRGRDAAAYALGAFLLCFAAGGFAFDLTGFLSPPLRVTFNVLAFGLTAGAIFAGFTLNERLSRGILSEPVLRVLRALALAYTAAYALLVVGSQLTLAISGCTLPFFAQYVLFFFAGALGVMAILGAAVVKSRLRERRVAWLFWSTVLCLVPFILLRSVDVILGSNLLATDWLQLLLATLPFVLLPVSYAYAILRYQVVDVSFVLNRALVYATLSTVLLASVTLVEAIAGKIALGKNASLAIELAVTLAIGISFNSVHKRLEGLIDSMLFSDKHRAEVALRQFALECGFIEKVATLRERMVGLVCSQARCGAAALYDRTATGYRLGLGAGANAFPGDIDADDAAFVRMRAMSSPVDLDGLASAIGKTGIVFPLAERGRIFGALVCGGRAHGEPYDPDERDLLTRVAQAAAAALVAAKARERADFVEAVATGSLDSAGAARRARELRDSE